MNNVKLFLSFICSAIILLIYGVAGIASPFAIVVSAVTIIHFLFVVWNREIFETLSGDVYTYGSVVLAINIISFIWTLTSGLLITLLFGNSQTVQALTSTFLYAIFLIGIVSSLAIQLLSNKHVRKLPKSTDQREYEDV